MCLGKSSEEEAEVIDQEEDHAGNSVGNEQEERSEGNESSPEGVGGGTVEQGVEEEHLATSGSAEHVSSDGSGHSVQVTDPATSENGNEEEMDKAAVLKAATDARLPHSVIGKVADAEGNGLSVLLATAAAEIEVATKRADQFEAKAVLGDQYIKSLRVEAIDWYVKAHATGDGPVNVDTLNKMLDRFGDDHELIRSVIDENQALAQAKFPTALRRSSRPTDPNAADVPEALTAAPDTDDQVSRFTKNVHG
jgi:hypothetical protein